jgi:hypothetical protein
MTLASWTRRPTRCALRMFCKSHAFVFGVMRAIGCLFIEATVKLLSAHETPCMLRAPFCRDDAPPHLMFLLFPPS